MKDEELRGEELQDQLLRGRELDDNLDQNDKLKTDIESMKNEMTRIKKYTIDIAGNPKAAIKGISDPILANLEAKI